MAVFVDTNVLIGISIERLESKELLLKYLEEGVVLASNFVIYESLWLLRSFYKYSKKDLDSFLEQIVKIKNLKFVSQHSLFDARSYYLDYKIKFGDCVILAHMKKGDTILSFDKDFAKVDWVKRVEV